MPTNPDDLATNLTKREHIATLVMQGILSDQEQMAKENVNIYSVALASVKSADALIAALNKEK